MKLSSLTFLAGLPVSIALWYILLPAPGNQPSRSLIKEALEHEKIEATYAMEAMRWYNRQRAHPTGSIPIDWREKAQAVIYRQKLEKSDAAASGLTWTSVGPNNIAGRARSIAVAPSNSNIVYCGSVSGGIWKSTDAGGTWSPTS